MSFVRKLLISTPGISLALVLGPGTLTRETRPDPKPLRQAVRSEKNPSRRDLHRQAVALNKKTRGR